MPEIDDTRDLHEFIFELDRAIQDQVVERLDASPELTLVRDVASKRSGIYALYFSKQLVYIGKASKGTTKSERTLRARLNEHVGKLANRENLSLDDMTCKFLTIESEWFVWAAEFALINVFSPEWNGSGYGSKTPGAGRPGTPQRVSRWNKLFPLNSGKFDSPDDIRASEQDDEAGLAEE